ncbi:MAG: AmmeMemoRadiSam system protein A [Verrucomicrobiales bacterium]|nr:AmmeMemoRadiSam system protein A [Verrucomicrobiales bacterium]
MGPKEPGILGGASIALIDGERLLDLARRSVSSALETASVPSISERFPSDGVLGGPGAVFVTLRGGDGRLRGCIGTLSPKFQTVAEETWRMAREAAFGDSRFPAVRAQELPWLQFEVSLVGPMEEVEDLKMLDPRRYGIVVSAMDGRRGALLPNIEGVETIEAQVSVARRKGGILPAERIRVRRFETWHFAEKGSDGGRDGGIANRPSS